MKKFLAMVAVVLILFIIPVEADATARVLMISPRLDFTGTTANCGVVVSANPGDDITVVLKLWRGSTCLKGWTVRDEYSLNFSDTCPVTRGQSYKVTADVSINNVAQDQVSVSKTCP